MKAMKWFPFAILVLAVAGLALTLLLPFYLLSVGSTLQTVALALTAIVKQRGPLRQASLSEPADEREDSWRDRANLNAYGIVSVVAMIGIGGSGMWMIFAFLHGRSVSPLETSMALIGFTMFLFTLFMVLPTLFASWTMPDLIEDEPEGRLSFLKPRRRLE
jgi:hypothetical protein